MHVRVFLSRFKSTQTCKVCDGKRLNKMMEQVKFSGLSISEVSNLPMIQLQEWLENIKLEASEQKLVEEVLDQMKSRVRFLNQIGLSYLTLLRPTKTLSGGEFQRLNISNQIGTDLTDTLYVLDEPTIGLHPRDNQKLIEQLQKLHKNNNTVVVVEHDPEVIKSADYIIEMGPESGLRGGEVIFSGNQKDFKSSNTHTSKYIYNSKKTGVYELGDKTINKEKAFEFFGCSGHNLKDVDFSVPLNQISVITGVSGSGKSSLISQTVYPALLRKLESKVADEDELEYKKYKLHKDIKFIEFVSQSRIMKSRRSIVATYVGLYDHIRKAFASEPHSKIMGFDAGAFSLNTGGGRCPTCKGLGYEEVEMLFMDNIEIPCETCGGKKFTSELLTVKYKGKNISEVLDMSGDEAGAFFSDNSKISKLLISLKSLKLDYLTLGQPLSTLSGGESQRLKLLKHLTSSSLKGGIFIFDEPSTGLHFNEIKSLIEVFKRLKEGGATIIIVEHNLDVMASADWLIDIGPEAGDAGGQIIAEGKPLSVAKKSGYTSEYLKKHLGL
jgi:excinuclease ABC subunit A